MDVKKALKRRFLAKVALGADAAEKKPFQVKVDPRCLEDAAKDPQLAEVLDKVVKIFRAAAEKVGPGAKAEDFNRALKELSDGKLTTHKLDDADMPEELRREIEMRIETDEPTVH